MTLFTLCRAFWRNIRPSMKIDLTDENLCEWAERTSDPEWKAQHPNRIVFGNQEQLARFLLLCGEAENRPRVPSP